MKSAENTLAVHRSAVFIDGMLNAAFSRDYILQMQKAGYTAIIVTLAMPFYSSDRIWQTLHDIAEWQKLFSQNDDILVPIYRTNDIVEAKRTGRVGIIFGIQDGGPFASDIELLRVYHTLGLRVASLAYNWRNSLADGCMEMADAGLSKLGRQAVQFLSELGILLCLSHVGHRSAMEALEIYEGPAVLTHSNARSICDAPRNAKDELLDAIATKGGVVGVSPLPMLLTRKKDKPERTIDDFFAHLDYIVQRIGVDHVGFGSDFYKVTLSDAISWNVAGKFLSRLQKKPCIEEDVDPNTYEILYPKGLSGVEEALNLTSGMLARGYSSDDIRKILGANFLRVFEAVWR